MQHDFCCVFRLYETIKIKCAGSEWVINKGVLSYYLICRFVSEAKGRWFDPSRARHSWQGFAEI